MDYGLIGYESVSHISYSFYKQVIRVLYFAAKPPDVNVNCSSASKIIVIPYAVKQSFPRINFAGIRS